MPPAGEDPQRSVYVPSMATCTHTAAGINPHTEALLHIPNLEQYQAADSHLNLMFCFPKAEWAHVGHSVSITQIQLTKPTGLQLLRDISIRPAHHPIVQLTNDTLLSITGPRGTWKFDLAHGALTSWQRRSDPDAATLYPNILTEPLLFDIYRAQTDNDRGCDFGRNWRDRRLNQAKHHLIQSQWRQQPANGVIEIAVRSRLAPPVLNWALEVTATYHFTGDAVFVRARAKPTGSLLPRAWGRLGLVTALRGCHRARWFGRGPGESYRDKKRSQWVGRWEMDAEKLVTDYEYPQENGNRTDVRWVEFLDDGRSSGPSSCEQQQHEDGGKMKETGRSGQRLLRARFGDFEGASFSALPWSARDLDEAQHPYELRDRRREDRVVHLDWMHHGLGTGSCGPETLPEYTLHANREYDVEVLLD